MNKTKTIKSPLRYPGGKSRAIKILDQYMPDRVDYYYEPFVGGGSVLMHCLQKYTPQSSFVGDIRRDLIQFYYACQSSGGRFDIRSIHREAGRHVDKPEEVVRDYLESYNPENSGGVKFFIGNRCSFLGDIHLSGFSSQAFKDRFTQSSVDRLLEFCDYIRNVKVDFQFCRFQELFRMIERHNMPLDNGFMFIDPPYYHNGKSKLYKNHKDFDHMALKLYMDKISPDCKFMLTYGDCPEIRELYKNYNIIEASWSYGIGADKDGKELIIRNYE